MKVISLEQDKLNNLKRLSLPNGIVNTEAELYVLNKGMETLVFKKIFSTGEKQLNNKLNAVMMLGDNKDKIGIDELVIPNYLVSINDEISGFTVPKIEGYNLGVIVNNSKISNEKKLEYLYKVGKLIKKTQKLNSEKIKFNFGDLHEYNFIVGEDDKTYAIDLDGGYLNGGEPQPSKYLTINKNLNLFPTKYIKDANGLIIPDNNSDLLYYNIMILNTIGRGKISKMNKDDYNEYISYLNQLGFGKDILKSFKNIYSINDNLNPCDYFEQIPNDKIGEAGLKVFEYKKKRGKI